MVPLDLDAAAGLLAREPIPPGALRLALGHALERGGRGFWGDHPRDPRSLVLLRPGDGPGDWRAHGAGTPGPALAWLGRRTAGSIALLAPTTWAAEFDRRSIPSRRTTVETWLLDDAPPHRPGPVGCRRLVSGDVPAFARFAPAWASRGWTGPRELIEAGAAFGFDDRSGEFVSLAWIHESAEGLDSIAAATDPRFGRLGLGFRAARALVEHVVDDRGREPAWVVASENEPSMGLARALGFAPEATEVVLRFEGGGPGR